MHLAVGIPLLVLAVVGMVRYFRTRQISRRGASQTLDAGQIRVLLQTGPWAGRPVVIARGPKEGDMIPAETIGLRATDGARGQYVVTHVDEVARQATAKWQLGR